MSRDRHSYCRLERGGDCALRMGRVIHSGSSLAAGRARSVTGQSPLPKKRHDRQSYGGQAVGTSWIAAPNSRAFASIRGLKFLCRSPEIALKKSYLQDRFVPLTTNGHE